MKEFAKLFFDSLKNIFSFQQIDAYAIVTIVFNVLIVAGIVTTSVFLAKYLKDYQVFEKAFAKIRGNAREYDRIRRKQIRKELEERGDSFLRKERKSESRIGRIYTTIASTGIVESIPGFSETSFIVLSLVVDVVLFLVGWRKWNIAIGGIFAGAFLAIEWYTLTIIAYNRRIKLEVQLLQFVNACATASLQYSNIIDIFGAIYEQFESPLRQALESCYVEAKQTNDKEAALKHMVSKFDSHQFEFVVDNLEICSTITGDYHATATDLSKTIEIYLVSHKKKMSILRNARINIAMLFGMMIGILFALSKFLDGLEETVFGTTIGIGCIVTLLLILFYGMNIKTEK